MLLIFKVLVVSDYLHVPGHLSLSYFPSCFYYKEGGIKWNLVGPLYLKIDDGFEMCVVWIQDSSDASSTISEWPKIKRDEISGDILTNVYTLFEMLIVYLARSFG